MIHLYINIVVAIHYIYSMNLVLIILRMLYLQFQNNDINFIVFIIEQFFSSIDMILAKN
jgi:hypothetical protein